METAILAAGCFWGVQYYFDQVPGVANTEAGYIGGDKQNPSYEEVCYSNTGHAEAVKIDYYPAQISYETLLKHFFRMHDPSQLDRQGPDVGTQYRSAIFYVTDEQRAQAEAVLAELKKDKKIATTIEKATDFWTAEDYHQKFTERTGHGMCHIPYRPLGIHDKLEL